MPLWMCKNAMNQNTKCVYVVCSSCYGIPERTTRNLKSKSKINKRLRSRQEHIIKSCKHEDGDLERFFDVGYIRGLYNNVDANIPRACIDCKK